MGSGFDSVRQAGSGRSHGSQILQEFSAFHLPALPVLTIVNRFKLQRAFPHAAMLSGVQLVDIAVGHAHGRSGMLFAMTLDKFLEVLAGVRYVFPQSLN